MIDPNLKYGSLWEYKGVIYRVLSCHPDHLIQDPNGQWVPDVLYTTKKYSLKRFHRACTEFVEKFTLITERVQDKPLSQNEIKVLMGVYDATNIHSSIYDLRDLPSWFFGFNTIRSYAGIEERLIRRTVRSLARKGKLEFKKGLTDEDGQAAGAGYGITKDGWNYVERIKNKSS